MSLDDRSTSDMTTTKSSIEGQLPSYTAGSAAGKVSEGASESAQVEEVGEARAVMTEEERRMALKIVCSHFSISFPISFFPYIFRSLSLI
jgi:hypothetical protein